MLIPSLGAAAMFNESQQRYLISRLRSLDESLTQSAKDLEPVDRVGVFEERLKADATSVQRKALGDHLAELRFVLRRFVAAHDLRDERDPISGLWSFRTALTFALITTEELRPKYLRGYGDVDPKGATAVERLAAELSALLRRIENYLARGNGGTLLERLSELSIQPQELGLLRELQRIILSHGLVEFLGMLELLVERAANPRFEVAVFGRVSTGKSSLLNWWLSQPLLPTGITPVTAIPTRVMYGRLLSMRVTLSSGSALDLSADQLPDYVTERGNPGNRRGVLEISIAAPSERLDQGICVVDTPGLGSLASASTARTLEYLPNCDLGILLIDAGAPVSRDDLDVARALMASGSELMVVASKADRLSERDLQQALEYTSEQLALELSAPVTVWPISTVDARAALAARWFEEQLVPRLAKHRELAAEALKRKLSVLREFVLSALKSRMSSGVVTSPSPASPIPPSEPDFQGTREEIAQARIDFARAQSELYELRASLPRFTARLLEAAAGELAKCWTDGERDEAVIRAHVGAALARRAEEPGHAAAMMLQSLRDQIQHVLERRGPLRGAVRELPAPRGRPVLDIVTASIRGERPPGLPPIRRLAESLARMHIRRAVEASVRAQLTAHGQALAHWGNLYLDELKQQFESAVSLSEGLERALAAAPSTRGETDALQRDLRVLQEWKAQALTHEVAE
jgi:GTP-binding protein EngB required for normal cell division